MDGSYPKRRDAIQKCARAARRRGYKVFAVQNGGWCASSATAQYTYNKYGLSKACKNDGKGGPWANQVYSIGGMFLKLFIESFTDHLYPWSNSPFYISCDF